MAVQRNDGRRRGRTLGPGAVLVVALLASAGCGVFGTKAPETITQTVTVSPSTSDNEAGGTPSSGAPVTVVAPSVLNPGSDSAATTSETPGNTDDAAATAGDGAETTASTRGPGAAENTSTAAVPTTSGTTTATTLDKEGRAIVRKLATGCDAVLTRGDITRVFGTSAISRDSLRISEEANPDNHMTARTKCYYGTADLAVARPLVVALAGFETPEAAARQVEVTTDSEKAAGAKASQAKVGGQTVQLLLRDGGFAMAQTGALTVSIAVADGIATDAKLTAALPSLMSAVLNHLG